MIPEKSFSGKFVLLACSVVYLANLCGNLCLKFCDPFFNTLYYLISIPTAIIIILVLPTLGIAKQLRVRLGFGWQGSIFLGLGLSAVLVPLVVFWFARLLGFNVSAVAGSLLIFSAWMMLSGEFKGDSSAQVYEEPLQNSRERWIFYSLVFSYIFLLSLAFVNSGVLSWRGVALPAIGDMVFVYGDVSAIVATGIPPENPFIIYGELSYYYFFHLYAAVYVLLSGGGLSVQGAVTFCVMACIAYVSFAFFYTARLWLKNFIGALLAMLLITFIGGWDIIGDAIVRLYSGLWSLDIEHWTDWTIFRIMTPITGFHFLPQHIFGILCYWLFFFFLVLRNGKKWPFCFLVLAGGLGYTSWGIIGAAPTVIVYVVIDLFVDEEGLIWRKQLRRWLGKVARIALTCAFATMAVLPIYVKAFGGSYIHGSPIRYWRIPPLNTLAWLGSDYSVSNPVFRLLGLSLIELGEFGPLFLLGIPGLFLCLRLKDRRIRNVLLAIFCTNFFLINSLNAGGTNPGECVSKVVGYFVWWALAIFAGLFVSERYRLEGDAMKLRRRFRRSLPHNIFEGIVICGLALGLASTLYSIAAKMHFDRMPVEDGVALSYIRENIPISARVQRSPYYPFWTIPGWGEKLTSFSTRWSAWEYLVPVPYVLEVQGNIEEAFRTTDAERAYRVFSNYGVEYILLTSFERERYGREAFAKFSHAPNLFALEWRQGNIEIFKLIR